MSDYKVGDRVKLITLNDMAETRVLGQEGTLIESDGHSKWPYRVLFGEGDDELCTRSNVTLVTEPKALKLEEVYTVAPIPELRKVIEDKGGVVADPNYPISEEGRKECVFLHDGRLDTIGSRPSNYLKGKTEVSIPVFLELLQGYTPPVKEVKLTLNSNITATVHSKEQEVVVAFDGDKQTFTFQQIKELEEGFKCSKSNGGFIIDEAEYCIVPTKAVAQVIEDIAKSTGLIIFLPVSQANTGGNSDYKVQWHRDSIATSGTQNFTHLSGNKQVTIDEFLKKCQVKVSTILPVLGDYQSKKVKAGEVYYQGKKAPEDGLAIGCQFIPTTSLEALFQAIK